ncbi:MAG: integrase family protein [Candidatus Saganbacteria bacterium]|uniref:Integrase family protein n=1 Tax=Candidatus Saganbacteria bacterium TaxID=2575572 RepID=A0A833L3G5_UNCSA|nr:MAG: integrase family protein [Candidatus Saganbacteria bacterium]
MDDYSSVWETDKRGILYAVFKLNGKVKWERIGEKRYLSRDAINAKKKEISERLARGEYITKKVSFETMAGEHLEYAEKNRTPRTKETMLGHLKKLVSYFKTFNLHQITPDNIEGYMDYRRNQNPDISDKMLINEIFTLSAMFKLAMKRGYVKENPVKRIELPKYIRPEMKFFSPQEIDLILNNCSPYMRGVILLGLTTGMRKSEICNLKWDNVNFDDGIITIACDDTFTTKSKRNRLAVIVPQLRDELLFLRDNYIDPLSKSITPRQDFQRRYVFCHYDGSHIKDFAQGFEKLMIKLGIKDASPHTMRHTFITYHSNYGDPFLTQKMAGHSNQRITQGYYHLQLDRMKESMKPIEKMINSGLPVRQSLDRGQVLTVCQLAEKN